MDPAAFASFDEEDAEKLLNSLLNDNSMPNLDLLPSDAALEDILGPLEAFTAVPIVDQSAIEVRTNSVSFQERQKVGDEIRKVSSFAPTAALQASNTTELFLVEGDDVLATLTLPVVDEITTIPSQKTNRPNNVRKASASSDEGVCVKSPISSPNEVTIIEELPGMMRHTAHFLRHTIFV